MYFYQNTNDLLFRLVGWVFGFVFVCRNGKPHLKIHTELQETLSNQNNLEEENNVGELKNVWYRCKDKHVDQWNRIKSSEINPNTYS